MATTYWTGGGSASDFDDASNWSGSAPGSGDTAVIADQSTTIADTTVTAAYSNLRIGEGFTGSIGLSVSGGQDVASALLAEADISTSAKLSLKGSVTNLTISETSSSSDGFKWHGSSDYLRILGGRGTIAFIGADNTTSVEVFGVGSAKITFDSASSISGSFVMDSGRVECSCGIAGTVEVRGGTLILKAGSYGTITITGGGKVIDERTATASITNLNVYRGEFDGRLVSGDVMTVGTVKLYEEGTIDERNGALAYTYTNPIQYIGPGDFYADFGRKLTQS